MNSICTYFAIFSMTNNLIDVKVIHFFSPKNVFTFLSIVCCLLESVSDSKVFIVNFGFVWNADGPLGR